MSTWPLSFQGKKKIRHFQGDPYYKMMRQKLRSMQKKGNVDGEENTPPLPLFILGKFIQRQKSYKSRRKPCPTKDQVIKESAIKALGLLD